MKYSKNKIRGTLLCGAALWSFCTLGAVAQASETAQYAIPPQPLDRALSDFGKQSGHPMLVDTALVGAKQSKGVMISSDVETALRTLLSGTGLSYRRNGEVFIIVAGGEARAKPVAVETIVTAAETVSGSAVEGLVVTAQKRREAIQDVPIAISAFSADALQAQKIEGGFDLLKAIPNVTFSKNNFSSYNFTIRGIGTKAVSVSTDPGVAVEFNDTPLIRNRLFEQEYFDVERVEVLRGPQGTLHGRNATAGVINVISNTADLDEFDGQLKGEVGNFHTKRLSGFVNVPLIENMLAVRFAGSLTSRDGYDYNATTQNRINGRDLWSGRLSIGFEPTERIRADFIWERFNEDDNRSRTGKQLCKRDPGREEVGGIPIPAAPGYQRGLFSQGCLPTNLYDDEAFGTPNGYSIPFLFLAATLPLGFHTIPSIECRNSTNFGGMPDPTCAVPALLDQDPYGARKQSRDLRVIESIRDPIYRADTDVFELNVDFDLTEHLTITSQTAYVKDHIYSFQDYNRFNTFPIFQDSTPVITGIWDNVANGDPILKDLSPGGIYCDPQIGCSNSIAGFDISQAESSQFSQEIRVQSAFDGPINFGAGVNYTRYSTLEDYYVMFNAITYLASLYGPLIQTFNYSSDYTKCSVGTFSDQLVDLDDPAAASYCVYIDPNPVDRINGDGHNYFRSKNPYHLSSYGAFGEVYWEMNDQWKLTAGLRYTDDRKTTTPVPSQVLLTLHPFVGGTAYRGYPANPNIEQQWQEVSGRIGVDWKPYLSFTDETMVYAFYSRGYKGGGANPPGIGYDDTFTSPHPLPYPELFKPEYVNAYELGAKNTLLEGSLVLNIGGFFYDYTDYQISQIKERTAVNENFSAKLWGVEIESIFQPSEDLRFNFAMGYQDTDVADGASSIDLMDRTAGNEGYIVVKPFPLLASNCVADIPAVVGLIEINGFAGTAVCPGYFLADFQPIDRTNFPNGGAGFYKELGGNELPNAPHWTVSFGAQYGWNLLDGNWRATVRGDAYWQSQSWARIYNFDPYDKLHGWYNANLSFWIEKPEEELKFEFYVKNVLDDTPITDAFLNSDDTALTTNVFTLDPRLIGLQVTKGF